MGSPFSRDLPGLDCLMQNTFKSIFPLLQKTKFCSPVSNKLMGASMSSSSTTSDSKKSIYDFSAKDIDGLDTSFEKYRGKVLLVVNVASQCGFTDSNYTQLKQLLDNNQEPGCGIDIKEFVNKKYNFMPDLYDKIDVNGDNEHPIYKYLKSAQGGILGFDGIKWNFTKFLIDKDGKVVERYSPNREPKNFEADVEKLLAA
uniref:Glutathione peroxidase n=1 Tax=Globodera rostochiensis TaxID=31243 RepID=A0A914IA19_GLORO